MIIINKYIWLRNIALLSICGFLCYSILPIPPILLRLLFLGVVAITLCTNINYISRLEKCVIGFWLLNLIYFGFADKPSISYMGNISVTLLSIPLFITLGKKGVMTEKFYLLSVIVLLLSGLVYYENSKYLVLFMTNRDETTINASVIFLYILSFIVLLKNRYISYGLILICVYFLMDGAKRGNIICAIPILTLFFVLTFRNKQVKFSEKLIFIIFFLYTLSWGIKNFEQNEFLQSKLEQTIDGDSSGRDRIYKNSWKVYSESESINNLLFGYGYQATVSNNQIGNLAHNDWLEILVDHGAVGAIIYISIFILLFQRIRKEKELQKRYVLITITSVWFLKSLFSMGYTNETMFVLFLSFGYAYSTERKVITTNIVTSKY